MKFSKLIAIAALVSANLLVQTVAVQAQETTAPAKVEQEKVGAVNLEQFAQDFSLNAAQKAKVKTILQAQEKKIAALRAKNPKSSPERRAKLEVIQKDTAAQMKAALSSAQYEKWQQMTQQ